MLASGSEFRTCCLVQFKIHPEDQPGHVVVSDTPSGGWTVVTNAVAKIRYNRD